MRHLLRILAAALLMLLFAGPALAQGRLFLTDEPGVLDERAIERAAQPLIDDGALVAVYFVDQGSDADFLRRLQADGLVSGGRAQVDMLGIYVGLDNRYSAIRYGENFNAALAINENYEAIRLSALNPGLASGDFSGAVADTLAAVQDAVVNPPTAGGGTELNIDPTPIVIGGLGLTGAAVGGVALARRRRAARALKDAADRFSRAKEDAGAVIADLGQRFRTAEERAQFDKVSYPPAEVDALTRGQAAARQQFMQAQNEFDDVGEGLERYEKLTVPLYEQGAAAYGQVKLSAEAAREALAKVEARRAELDELARQAPGEIDRAKKS